MPPCIYQPQPDIIVSFNSTPIDKLGEYLTLRLRRKARNDVYQFRFCESTPIFRRVTAKPSRYRPYKDIS